MKSSLLTTLVLKGDFDETKHPRTSNGRWAPGHSGTDKDLEASIQRARDEGQRIQDHFGHLIYGHKEQLPVGHIIPELGVGHHGVILHVKAKVVGHASKEEADKQQEFLVGHKVINPYRFYHRIQVE